MTELLVVLVLVGLALAYLVVGAVKKSRGGKSSCGSGCGCGSKRAR